MVITITRTAFILILSFAHHTLTAQDVWIKRNLPQGGAVEHVVVTPDGNIFAQIAFKGMYRSTDEGMTWTSIDFPISVLNDFISDYQGNLFLIDAAGTGNLFRSTNKGSTWDKIYPLNSGVMLAFDTRNRLFVLTKEYGLVYSDDEGKTIHETSAPHPSTGFSSQSEIHITSTDDIFTLNATFFVRSTDRGQTWDDIYVNLSGSFSVGALTSDIEGNLYVGNARYNQPPLPDSYILRSTDNGDTWAETNLPAPWYSPQQMVSPAAGTVVCLTQDTYVIRTTDYGETWENYFSGMDHGYGYDLTLTPDGRAVIGSAGCIYITAQPVGVGEPLPAPESLSLSQNYPNPVGTGQNAYINFTLPSQQHVALTVCNTSGQEVATLAEGTYQPGTHTAQFSTAGLPTGVYLYRLIAGDKQESKLMQVVR